MRFISDESPEALTLTVVAIHLAGIEGKREPRRHVPDEEAVGALYAFYM